jgi:hypothetical protein
MFDKHKKASDKHWADKAKTKVNKAKKKAPAKKKSSATTVTVKRFQLSQIYPDIMRTKMKASIDRVGTHTVGGATTVFSYYGNQITAPGVGPQVNFTGSFATNYPTGAFQLIGSQTPTGGTTIGAVFVPNGVYSRYRVLSSSITIHFTPADTLGVVGDTGYEIYVLPNTLPASAKAIPGMLTNEQLREQPYVKYLFTPASITAKVPVIRHHMTTAKMFGLRYKSLLEAQEYTGASLSGVTNSWVWDVYVSTIATAGTNDYFIAVDIEYDIEFFDRNNITSTGPT